MKKSILFVLFAMVSVMGFSQFNGWNAKVGMNLSSWSEDEVDTKLGFRAGVGTEYMFSNILSLQPSLFFSLKGCKADSEGELEDVRGKAKVTVNQMYLELPVMLAARFNVANKTNLVVTAGPYAGYGIGGKTKVDLRMNDEKLKMKFNSFGKVDKVTIEQGGKTQDVPLSELVGNFGDIEFENNDNKFLNRFDFGLGVGLALEFNRFIVGLDGQFGLTELADEGPKNLNYAVSVGYKF